MTVIVFEKSFHYPKLDESRTQKKQNFDNASPFNMTFGFFQSLFMSLIPFNMKLLIS